jgi:hypothetical protein
VVELSRHLQAPSLHSAIQHMRPWFLSGRGRAPAVSIDGGPAVEISVLYLISVRDVLEIRLERASSSVGRQMVTPDGRVVVGDLIVVTTRQR